jgi:hypothetical protein
MATKRRNEAAEPHGSEVSRRRFLQDVIAASAATGAAAALPVRVAASEPAAAAPVPVADAASAFQVLTIEQAGLLEVVLNRLIPGDGVMPPAGDVGVAAYIDGVLADAAHLRHPILDVLSEVARANETEVRSPDALDALLARIECTHRGAFASLIEAAYTGYYTHPQVLQALGWHHPGSHADTSETLDLALLENVVSRGPVYKHA